jgi:hypothetical protein
MPVTEKIEVVVFSHFQCFAVNPEKFFFTKKLIVFVVGNSAMTAPFFSNSNPDSRMNKRKKENERR